MHQQQCSSANSNCKDITGGTHQTLAKTTAESFIPCLWPGLLHFKSVMSLLPSSAEISARPQHCWLPCCSAPGGPQHNSPWRSGVDGAVATPPLPEQRAPVSWEAPRASCSEWGASTATPWLKMSSCAAFCPVVTWAPTCTLGPAGETCRAMFPLGNQKANLVKEVGSLEKTGDQAACTQEKTHAGFWIHLDVD